MQRSGIRSSTIPDKQARNVTAASTIRKLRIVQNIVARTWRTNWRGTGGDASLSSGSGPISSQRVLRKFT